MSRMKTIAIAGLAMVSCACSHSTPVEGKDRQNLVYDANDSRGEADHSSGAPRKDYAPGQILVKFREGTDGKTIEAIQENLKLKTLKVYPQTDLFLMKIEDGSSVEEVIRRLTALPEVSHAEPNFKFGTETK